MVRKDVSDLEFVRIESRGKGVFEKFWVNDEKYKLVKLSSDGLDQDVMEYLSYVLLRKLDLECVDVELGFDSLSNKNCCLVTNFLNEADVSYDLLEWKTVVDLDEVSELKKCFEQLFNKYASLYGITIEELEDLKRSYIRVIFGKCIIGNFDTKLENIGLIFNEKTGKYRLPPSYDNGMAFISYNSVGGPSCCIGNQYFNMSLVVDYILENYFDYISDVLPNLDTLSSDLDLILSEFDIIPEKKTYIVKYITELNNKVNFTISRNK